MLIDECFQNDSVDVVDVCRCVFDTKPRKMKAEEYNLLSNFSEIAMRRLEEREFKRIKAAPPTASATLLVSPDFFPRTLSVLIPLPPSPFESSKIPEKLETTKAVQTGLV